MDGWNKEQLCKLDAVVVGWRKLAARFNRGIQGPPPRFAITTDGGQA